MNALGRRLATGLTAVLCGSAALAATATLAHAATPSAVFTKVSDWGSGWEGKYTINAGDSAITSWKLEFDLPAGTSVSSYWDALETKSGTHYTFTNTSWNGSVAANGSVSFGLLGAGPGSPANCTVNGAACGGGTTPSPSPTPKPTPSTTPSPNPSPSPTPTPKPSPTPTPAPTPTPTPGTPGALPKHTLTGYWQNFTNPARSMRLRDVPAQYDVVAVAFADATATPGAISFTVDSGLSAALGGYTNADFKADITTLHSRGAKVILSVGGQNGTVGVNSPSSQSAFATSATQVIRDFGFDGIDIDLENGVSSVYMGGALRSVRTSIGSGLIITMAPQTIDMQSAGTEYFKLALAIKDILTTVHTQYYNSGSMLGCDQMQAYSQGTENFLTALACIQLENGLRPDQVALGLPAGNGAAGGGVVAPSVVTSALDCLARGTSCGSFKPPHTYPGIRGAMTWSVNWDATNGGGFASTVGPFVHALQ
ncbi:MAG: chitinase [Cryptosporangiaceae bacterium]|nr:chitinase [Cryptosporangiaceae bacterium]